jgi:hypothetical protein
VYGISVDKKGYTIWCRLENNWLFNDGAQFMFFNILFIFHTFFFLFDEYFEKNNQAKEPPSPKATFSQQYCMKILFLHENVCQYFNNMYLHGIKYFF